MCIRDRRVPVSLEGDGDKAVGFAMRAAAGEGERKQQREGCELKVSGFHESSVAGAGSRTPLMSMKPLMNGAPGSRISC